eukprot:65274_1
MSLFLNTMNTYSYQMFNFDDVMDLFVTVLDPCKYISDQIESVSEFHVSMDSIITRKPKIYDENKQDITNNLSPIISNIKYHHLLYSIIRSVINIDLFDHLSQHNSIELYNLVASALYVSKLIGISLSIPGETMFEEFNDFSLLSFRVSNEEINVTVNDIDIFIPHDVTNTGDSIFDSVDVVIIGMETMTSNVSVLLPNDGNNDIQQAIISNQSVSVTITGNNTDTNHLASNVEFLFPFYDTDLSTHDDTFTCVWYNQQLNVWQTDGCVTTIKQYTFNGLDSMKSNIPDRAQLDHQTNNQNDNHNKTFISCSCSHVTTFATIHNIHSIESVSSTDNKYISTWMSSDEWDYINFLTATLFGMIFIYSIRLIYPFYVYKKSMAFKWSNHRSVICMILIGITAFLHLLCNICAYLTKKAMSNNGNGISTAIKLYSIFQSVPQMTYFMIFSMIAYSWFTIAHGFMPYIDYIKKNKDGIINIKYIYILCF